MIMLEHEVGSSSRSTVAKASRRFLINNKLDSLSMDPPILVRKRALISMPVSSVHVHGTGLLCVVNMFHSHFIL